MHEHLFTPLQMQQTYTDWTEARNHGVATGYRYWFGVPVPGELAIDRAGLPSGGVTASVEDVAHFLIEEIGNFAPGAIPYIELIGNSSDRGCLNRSGRPIE